MNIKFIIILTSFLGITFLGDLSGNILSQRNSDKNKTIESAQPIVKKVNSDQIRNLIEQRNGKTLLLNIWATWCLPCREELPSLNKLLNHYSNDKIDIITISVDFPDEIEKKILPFLKSINANFTSYVADISNDSELINILNPNWNGSLPATFIYNKEGKQTSTLYGKKDYNDFTNALERFLK